jgi:hypothetical protein
VTITQTTSEADILVDDQGSIVRIKAQTNAGRTWIDENVDTVEWTWLGPWLCIDHRMAGDILSGMENDGLVLGNGG